MEIKDIKEYFGSKAAIAKALNISRAAVSRWNSIPPRRVYELNEIIAKQSKRKRK